MVIRTKLKSQIAFYIGPDAHCLFQNSSYSKPFNFIASACCADRWNSKSNRRRKTNGMNAFERHIRAHAIHISFIICSQFPLMAIATHRLIFMQSEVKWSEIGTKLKCVGFVARVTTASQRPVCMAHVQCVVQTSVHISLHMQNKSFHVYSNRSSRILFNRALLIWFFFFFTRWYSHSWRFLGEKSNNKKTTHRRQKDANHLAFYLYGICCECIQWALSLQLMILISHGRHSARMVAMEIIYVFTPNSTQPAMGHWLFVKTRNCGCWDCALWYAEHFERGIENHCTKPKWIMLWIGFQTCLLISNMI